MTCDFKFYIYEPTPATYKSEFREAPGIENSTNQFFILKKTNSTNNAALNLQNETGANP